MLCQLLPEHGRGLLLILYLFSPRTVEEHVRRTDSAVTGTVRSQKGALYVRLLPIPVEEEGGGGDARFLCKRKQVFVAG